jgi:hypothetical protein
MSVVYQDDRQADARAGAFGSVLPVMMKQHLVVEYYSS